MDVSKIRKDFPTLKNRDTVYLDSACQSLKPYQVIDAITSYYTEFPGCGGRSVHRYATRVSMEVDESRETVATFFGSKDPNCFVFTKNCTEGINMVAGGFGLKRGDTVLTTDSEHNSNHIPWHNLSESTGIKRKFVRTSKEGMLDIEDFKTAVKGTDLVSVVHTSNVTGVTYPIKEMTEIAHDAGAYIMVDGAQAAPHMPVDVVDLDVDFYSVSVHKMLGPTGMGVLYGKEERLRSLKQIVSGGGTVGLATYDSIKLTPPPERFEAGLANYSGIIGAKAAFNYLADVGLKNVKEHELSLQRTISSELQDVKGLEIVGPEDPNMRGGIFSFNITGLSSHDIAVIMDNMSGVMIRSGMHCTHPFFESRRIKGAARASSYLYNDEEEITRFADAVKSIVATFSK